MHHLRVSFGDNRADADALTMTKMTAGSHGNWIHDEHCADRHYADPHCVASARRSRNSAGALGDRIHRN